MTAFRWEYPWPWLDEESKKIISARILSKLVVSVAMGNSNYVSKFQLSSSNGLGDIRVFVTKIDDQKGDRFHHLFVENLAPAEIARVQELREAKFSKSKKHTKNLFFEVVSSGHKKWFRVDWAILHFFENFSANVNLDFEYYICRNSGLRKFSKNLKKIDFSILVYLDVSENLESFDFFQKI